MAKLPLKFHPEAHAEMMNALEHYSSRSPDAASLFVDEIDQACRTIQESPETWSLYLQGTRRFLVRRFPYLLVYRLTEKTIEIVAVAHGHRKPGYWRDRL